MGGVKTVAHFFPFLIDIKKGKSLVSETLVFAIINSRKAIVET
jgi:hypothetical protein